MRNNKTKCLKALTIRLVLCGLFFPGLSLSTSPSYASMHLRFFFYPANIENHIITPGQFSNNTVLNEKIIIVASNTGGSGDGKEMKTLNPKFNQFKKKPALRSSNKNELRSILSSPTVGDSYSQEATDAIKPKSILPDCCIGQVPEGGNPDGREVE